MNSGFRPAAQPSNLLLCSIYSDIHSDHSEDQPHEHTLDLLCVDVGRTLHYYSSPHTDLDSWHRVQLCRLSSKDIQTPRSRNDWNKLLHVHFIPC